MCKQMQATRSCIHILHLKHVWLGPEISGLLVKVLRNREKVKAVSVQHITQGNVMRSCYKASEWHLQNRHESMVWQHGD